MWPRQNSTLLNLWPAFEGCRGHAASGCCSTDGTAHDRHSHATEEVMLAQQLGCFTGAKVEVVEVFVPLVDTALL